MKVLAGIGSGLERDPTRELGFCSPGLFERVGKLVQVGDVLFPPA
jgi:hypothetical protein